MAQLRFVGRVVGLYPTDPLQQLEVDEIVETTQELLNRAPQSRSPDKKRSLREEYTKSVMIPGLRFMDGRIAARGGEGYAGGDALSIADLCLVSLCSLIEHGNFEFVPATLCNQFPALTRLLGRLRVRTHVYSRKRTRLILIGSVRLLRRICRNSRSTCRRRHHHPLWPR